MKGKKGQAMQTLAGLAVGIATLAIVLTVTFLILSEGRAEVADIEGIVANGGGLQSNQSSLAINSTNTMIDAVSGISGWVPLIVIGVIGSALLGLVALFRRR